MNKINVYELLVNENSDKIVIGLDKQIEFGASEDELLDFKNIKYSGTTLINNPHGSGTMEVHKIEFQNINPMMYELITKYIFKFITNLNNDYTICEIFSEINDYLSCVSEHKKLVKKLLGDIAEILFILLLKNNKIDYKFFYQKTANSLYDFYFNNFCIDVKAISPSKKIIKTSYRQISIVPEIYFYCFEINKLQNGKNILALLNEISDKNDYLKELDNEWQMLYKYNKSIIDSWTVDRAIIKNYLIDNSVLPKISIIEENGLKEMLLNIDISNCRSECFEEGLLKKIKESIKN